MKSIQALGRWPSRGHLAKLTDALFDHYQIKQSDLMLFAEQDNRRTSGKEEILNGL